MENSRHESIELQTVQNLIPTFFIIYLDYVYTIGIFDIETFQHCTIIDLFMMHVFQLPSYLNLSENLSVKKYLKEFMPMAWV